MSFITALKEKMDARAETKKNVDSIKYNYDLFVEREGLNPLLKLYYLISKNLKLLIRSKTSALVFIFGPLLITFLVALAFNTSTLFDLNVAVYSDSYSTLSDSITQNLSSTQYNVLKLDTEEDCIDAVKFGDFQVCLVFPPNMALDNSANNVIKIYVDNSRLNIANLISSQISSKVTVEASALSADIVTQILTTLDTANTETVQSQEQLTSLFTSNSALQSSISSISSSLNNLDFTYSTANASAIDDEITNLQTSKNLSDEAVATLEDLVGGMKSAYAGAISKLDTAKSSVEDSKSSISSLSASAQADKQRLDTVQENINIVMQSIDGVKITNVANIVAPLRTSIEPLSSSNSYLLYILPTILILLIMFVSLLMSSSAIITEKTSRAFFRNSITPTSSLLMLVGEYLSNLCILMFQVGAILSVLFYFFNDLGVNAFVLAGITLLVIGTFFIFLGMLIGYLFNTKQTVTLAAISTGIVLLFFSNTILPLETLSKSSRAIVSYNPFVIGEGLLKKILLFSLNITGVVEPLVILGIFCAILFVGIIAARRFSQQSVRSE